jgi:Peptidase family M23
MVASFEQPDTFEYRAPTHSLADYPKNYFICPISGDVKLTGTFGELRPDHFHSGLDFKSPTGKVGQPVFAAADGFIDRVRVQANGYGNVLYVKHPNGYSTLYGHLDEFSSEIAAYVKAKQYEKERFEVDLNPSDGQFKVKKGHEIGKMGNSGSSSGPHLHFEIRNSTNGKVLNPELFGLPVPDDVAPDMRDMKVYFLNEHREVMGTKALSLQKDKKGFPRLNGDTIKLGGWRVGFGMKVYDSMSGFKNDNGIYSLTVHADDQLAFEWKMDELEFDETRYMNAHIDYPALKKFGAWFHRCFVLPGDRMSNYTKTESMGSIALYREKPVKVTIKATDASGNSSTVYFWALRDDENMETFVGTPYQYEFKRTIENRIDTDDFSLLMGKGVLYEDLKVEYVTDIDNSTGIYSSVHHIHDNQTPVHKSFEVSIKPYSLPEALKSKAIIAQCGNGRPDNCGGEWRGDRLFTKVRRFGQYCVMADTELPSIVPVVFNTDMKNKLTMSFNIRDNFDISGTADGLSYRGTVDDKWVLFEFDSKRNRLTHTFDERIGSGEHILKLNVKDDRGNVASFERYFLR